MTPTDANLAVGLENYVLGLKPAPLRWVLRISGAQTDQEQASPEPTPELPQVTPPPPPVEQQSELPISTPTPTPTPEPKERPSPRPSVERTPKPTPKPTPKRTPRSTQKPAPKSTPKPSPEHSPKPKASPGKPEKKETPSLSPADDNEETAGAKPKGKQGHGEESSQPGLDSGSGSGESGLEGYVGILTNRFQAAWDQPTSEISLGKTLSVTVKIKIEADGTVTEFEIVEGSGNAVVDDSVREAGKKLIKLPPPPNGRAFSAPVRFELGN